MIRSTKVGVAHIGFPINYENCTQCIKDISLGDFQFVVPGISTYFFMEITVFIEELKRIKLWRNPKNMMKKLSLLRFFGLTA